MASFNKKCSTDPSSQKVQNGSSGFSFLKYENIYMCMHYKYCTLTVIFLNDSVDTVNDMCTKDVSYRTSSIKIIRINVKSINMHSRKLSLNIF